MKLGIYIKVGPQMCRDTTFYIGYSWLKKTWQLLKRWTTAPAINDFSWLKNNGKIKEVKIDKNCYCVVVVERNASQHPVAMMQQNNQAPVFKSLPEAAYASNVYKYIRILQLDLIKVLRI